MTFGLPSRSVGMNQAPAIFSAPLIRPSSSSCRMRRPETPRRSAASATVQNPFTLSTVSGPDLQEHVEDGSFVDPRHPAALTAEASHDELRSVVSTDSDRDADEIPSVPREGVLAPALGEHAGRRYSRKNFQVLNLRGGLTRVRPAVRSREGGGADGTRTRISQVLNPALYLLSYRPDHVLCSHVENSTKNGRVCQGVEA